MAWTSIIAFWGAITGTISILLQLRSFLRDRPSIVVSTRLGVGVDRKFEVLAVNHGRRPIYTDALLVEFRADLESGERSWREECREPLTQRELKEGEGATFYVDELLLEFGDEYQFIHRVGVRDKTGKVWWSKSRTGERALLASPGVRLLLRHYETEGRGELYLFKEYGWGYTLEHSGEQDVGQRYWSKGRAVSAFNRKKKTLLEASTRDRSQASTGAANGNSAQPEPQPDRNRASHGPAG